MAQVGKDERILVSVRMRPLNAKEIAGNDPSDWDCLNTTTIVFKSSGQERALYPTSYTFDKAFGYDCTTQQVYVEGAKDVALSVVNGINASIFAYGQTSSGKTYTMTGITDCAIEDIYDYIKKHKERDFVLKFSAMEIYNEAVRDLLSSDSAPLRLLDDAERGTVVEKLTEETVSDQMHLKELLSFCEAQRQVGETSLNETSSRSHQILRLTIESTPHMFVGKGNSSTLLAAVNFVDLAGSERSSQISSSGVRVKEGCHINRSLLTLGKVIRQLSKGRNGHIPYRDSKLTRILQPFLGGNARTAIICTMSPARSHVEQSRNTLSFAICAKQVVTNARVNLVMSDKQMVKLLKLELARLENELRQRGFATCTNHSDVLKNQDAQIRKMEQEIKELMYERDFSQSRLQDLLRFVGEPRQWDQFSQSEMSLANSEYEDTYSISGASGITYQIPDFDSTALDTPEEMDGYNRMRLELLDKMNPSRCSISSEAIYEDQCKEVQCIEIHDMSISGQSNLLSNENVTDVCKLQNPSLQCDEDIPCATAMEQSINITTKTNGNSDMPNTEGSFPSPWVPETMHSKVSVLTRSRSCIASLMNDSVLAWLENVHQANKTEPYIFKKIPSAQPECSERRTEDAVLSVSVYQDIQRFTSVDVIEIEDTKTIPQDSDCNDHASPELNVAEKSQNQRLLQDETHNQELLLTSADMINIEDIKTIHQDVDVDDHACTTSSMSNMMESQNHKLLQEFQDNQELLQLPFNQCAQQTVKEDNEVHRNIEDVSLDPVQKSLGTSWPLEFEKKRREIIELWQAYNVSLIHRTCFFLLFKGDQSDAFYMEVERRRLSFLGTISCGKAGEVLVKDVHEFRPSTSLRYLCRERERLCREMKKKLQTVERKKLFAEWGIALNSKKRSFQLTQRLWARTDIEHVRASASLVAKLIGFVEKGEGVKEMFILSFIPQKTRKRSFGQRYLGCGMPPFMLI
ncbi:kinesin-like protein KIN-7J isoform X1 [Zingiber officinale]|uniref:kinesin-like protein KIN-7J isoform X1 n=1 Tax=Zingiber officinale TaxID=94328 RepID=UPI001C4C419E|nr:kinesin-like protein KIN-7J isoform X1 [Zingiber officinale]XP_042471329.1 kinesin-like protein KIN-7J isoform X1 [Zingiber officinale]